MKGIDVIGAGGNLVEIGPKRSIMDEASRHPPGTHIYDGGEVIAITIQDGYIRPDSSGSVVLVKVGPNRSYQQVTLNDFDLKALAAINRR